MLSAATECCFCRTSYSSPCFVLYKQLGKSGWRKWRQCLLSRENMSFLPPGQDAWNFLSTGSTFAPRSFLLASLTERLTLWSEVLLGVSFACSLLVLFMYPVLPHFYALHSLCAVGVTCEPCVYSPCVHHVRFWHYSQTGASFVVSFGQHVLLRPERVDLYFSRGSYDQH